MHRDMVRRAGNPSWGKPMPIGPATPSEFEIVVKRLRLKPEKYASSWELKEWCKRNWNRRYVPEWLLKQWGMDIEINHDFS
jgi:hypothetical protein